MRNCFRRGMVFLAFAAAVSAQSPKLAFEVATIKPSAALTPDMVRAGKLHVGMSVDKARVDIGFFSLSDLIRTAYKVKAFQISGPDWLSAQRFDILAKMPDGATEEQVPEMLQSLIAERFKVELHHSTKEQPVYVLVVAKGGSKLKEAAADADAPPTEAEAKNAQTITTNQGKMSVNANPDGQGATIKGGPAGAMKMSMQNGSMHMEFKKMSMDRLVDMLSGMTDKPVVDQTELKGNYEVALDLSMDDMRNAARKAGAAMGGMGMPMAAGGAPGGGPLEATDPSATIFSSIAQMGLKLESRKAPLDLLVIDKAEKMPTEN